MKFVVAITLSTTEGELPTNDEVERLVYDQMQGELDEATGLECINVRFIRRTARLV